MSKEEKQLKETMEKWLGRLILVKYAGFVVFGVSLGLFVVSSLLQMMWLMPWLQNILLLGLALIIIGLLGEKVLTYAS